jgi:hypothetical protein
MRPSLETRRGGPRGSEADPAPVYSVRPAEARSAGPQLDWLRTNRYQREAAGPPRRATPGPSDRTTNGTRSELERELAAHSTGPYPNRERLCEEGQCCVSPTGISRIPSWVDWRIEKINTPSGVGSVRRLDHCHGRKVSPSHFAVADQSGGDVRSRFSRPVL